MTLLAAIFNISGSFRSFIRPCFRRDVPISLSKDTPLKSHETRSMTRLSLVLLELRGERAGRQREISRRWKPLAWKWRYANVQSRQSA